jgi:hypothetical protein
MRVFIGAAAILGLSLFADGAAARTLQPETVCAQTTPTSFTIAGRITRATAECVASTLQPGTTELIVDSAGGELAAALDIAERIAPAHLTVRVRGSCHSACANYFIPVARRLVVEPGAYILIHGGADPKLVHEQLENRRDRELRQIMRTEHLSRAEAEARFERNLVTAHALVERQRDFARRYGVGLGWFIYREQADEGLGRYLVGERGPKPHPFGYRYVLAEEMLVRSCVPRVEIEPFQQQLEAGFINNPARYRDFRRLQGLRSLTLRCGDPGGGAALVAR